MVGSRSDVTGNEAASGRKTHFQSVPKSCEFGPETASSGAEPVRFQTNVGWFSPKPGRGPT